MKKPAHLTSAQAKERTHLYGPNALREKKPPTVFALLVGQLKSPLVYILLIAALITIYLSDWVDAAIILAAVVLNTIFGFLQENKAQQTLHALKKVLTPKTRVMRDNIIQIIDASALVPGDVVLVSAGDRIPADGLVVEAANFFMNEAILTGESKPVAKVAAKDNVFMGTIVASGRATIRVVRTGMTTEIGKIAETLEETAEEPTPLQRELQRLARMLAILVVTVSLAIFGIGIATGADYVSMFTTSVALAVSAIPEGMVVALTVILAVGMQAILRRRAVVRRLASAETLGSVTVLCVDKTGTLTEGLMRVAKTELLDESKALLAAIFANNLEDPLEVALWDWARDHNHIDPQEVSESVPRDEELPFDPLHKLMAAKNKQGLWIKGAPEVVLEASNLPRAEKAHWTGRIEAYGKAGLRVLALAHKDKASQPLNREISQLQFLGIVGIADPIRPGVAQALAVCRQAGLSVKVVTGDYRYTAESVLSQLGIKLTDPSRQIMEGRELEGITAEDLARRVKDIVLFSRVTPHQKLAIVQALQSTGEVVAMTGDGVNDALALKKADVGIVVAQSSDVAKETADLVLLDSNFGTIVAAIEEGRGIFQNIRKVVLYLLSDSFTEVIVIVGSIFFGLPLPLTAAQILWINILSDGLPFLALSVEPKDADLMRKKPRGSTEPIVNGQIRTLILLISLASGLMTLGVFVYALSQTGNLVYARTLAFTVLGVDTLIYVFSCRSLEKPIWQDKFFKNPWLIGAVGVSFLLQVLVVYLPVTQGLFHISSLSLSDWGLVLSVGLVVVFSIEAAKYLSFNLKKQRT